MTKIYYLFVQIFGSSTAQTSLHHYPVGLSNRTATYSLWGTNWIFVQCRLISVLNLLWQSALRQIFSRAPRFSSVINFPPILFAHHVNKYSYHKDKRERPGKLQKKKSPFECLISGFRRNRGLRLSGMLTRLLLFVSCRRFGTLCPNLKDPADWLLKMGPIGWAETSAANYQTTLCNIPEERIRPVGCRRVVGRKVVWHWSLSLQDGQVANNAAARCWLLICPAHKLIM